MFRARILLLVAISSLSAMPVSAHAFDFSTLMGQIEAFRDTFFVAPFLGSSTQEAQPYRVFYQPAPARPRWVHAQTAGFGGGSGMLVTHYREVTPPGGSGAGGAAAACPSGWTTAVHGYGPHYIGITTYGLLVGGVEQGWTDPWWYPGDPGGSYRGPGGEVPEDTDDEPPEDEPRPGEPRDPPPGGGGGEEPEDPPPPPEGGGPITPGGGYDPPPPTEEAPNGGESASLRSRKKIVDNADKNVWRLVRVAHAQSLPAGQEYFVKDMAIGSDSVCSDSENAIVPFEKIYNNMTTPKTWSAESSACFTDASTGIKVCNRCYVCVK
jgi:hypothetical protein